MRVESQAGIGTCTVEKRKIVAKLLRREVIETRKINAHHAIPWSRKTTFFILLITYCILEYRDNYSHQLGCIIINYLYMQILELFQLLFLLYPTASLITYHLYLQQKERDISQKKKAPTSVFVLRACGVHDYLRLSVIVLGLFGRLGLLGSARFVLFDLLGFVGWVVIVFYLQTGEAGLDHQSSHFSIQQQQQKSVL